MNQTLSRPRQTPAPGEGSADRAGASQAVFYSGVAFIGLFLISVALTILPPALLQPVWQVNVALTLQSNGLQALIGTAMLASAPLLDPDNLRLNRAAERIRRFAAWICVGWLLLIPLLVSSGAQLLRESRSNAQLQLRQFDQQIAQLQQTRDEQSFRVQFAVLSPSSPPFPVQLPASLERVRAEAVRQFKAQRSLQQTKLDKDFRARSESFALQILRSSLLSVLLTAGFAAIGRWRTNGPTLLSDLLQWLDAKHPGSLPQRIQASLKSLQRLRKPTVRQAPAQSMSWRWRRQWQQWFEAYQRHRSMARSQAAARANQRRHQARRQAAAKNEQRR